MTTTTIEQLVRNALSNAIDAGYRDELVGMSDAVMVQDLYDTDAEIETFVGMSFKPLVEAVATVRKELGI